jgi:predicted nucleotide-binding protein
MHTPCSVARTLSSQKNIEYLIGVLKDLSKQVDEISAADGMRLYGVDSIVQSYNKALKEAQDIFPEDSRISGLSQIAPSGVTFSNIGRMPSELPRLQATAQTTKVSISELLSTLSAVGEKEKHGGGVSNRVFVVHGHDETLKNRIEIFLRELGLTPIVLHREPDQGRTIIEKLEDYSDVSYAFVLLTPDDVGYPKEEETKPDEQRQKEPRARQNVIFELGFFVGLLGRKRVCCLYKSKVALPTDIFGILYKNVATDIQSIGYELLKELKAAGYEVKM